MYEDIRGSFLNGLGEYYARDIMPSGISINMRRALTEHKRRLSGKGIHYAERYIPSAEQRSGHSVFGSGSFVTANCYMHCNAITQMSDGHTGIRCDEAGDDIVYLHIIDRGEKDAAADDTRVIVCPNCGNQATAGVFVDGCPMCGTRFEIDDLYPCVNAYYSMPWPMPTSDSVEKGIDAAGTVAIKVGIVVAILTFLISCGISNVIIAVFAGAITGFLIGWITFLIGNFVSIGMMSAKSISGLAKVAGNTLDLAGARNSKQKAETAIRPYDPDFAFELFEGKVLSSIRTIAYSDNRKDCSLYSGTDDLSFMNDLVDIRYRGATEFLDAVTEGDNLRVKVKVYLDNIYYVNGKFTRERENFGVELVRRKDVHTSADFTIYSVNCRTCAGTFDAVLSRRCPHCGSEYELTGQDWSIARISKM